MLTKLPIMDAQTQRRKSALEEAQDLALSFALDDGEESIASLNRDHEEVAKEKEMYFARQGQRLSSSFSRETRSSSTSECSTENMNYRWARAQALATAMSQGLDSEDDEDGFSSDDVSTSSKGARDPKVNDIFSQMHLAGESVCQDPSCQCKSVEFTVSRRTLPRTSLTRKISTGSSEKSYQSFNSAGEYRVSRRTPSTTFIRKGSNHSVEPVVRKVPAVEAQDSQASFSSSALRTMEERFEMRASVKEGRFQAESRGRKLSRRGTDGEASFVKTVVTECESSDGDLERQSELSDLGPFKSRMIHALLGTVVLLVIAIVVVVLSKGEDAAMKGSAPDETALAQTSSPEVPTYGTIAFVPETICMEQVPGDGWSSVCEAGASAKQGGGVCNLVAQAYLDQVINADIAFQSASSCLGDILEGNFTVDDATRVLPFYEELWTIEVSGATIALVLENVMEGIWGPTNVRDYPYAAGIRFSVNASAAAMNRVSNIEVNERFEHDVWKPIEQNIVYTIVAGKTLLTGGILTRENPYQEFEQLYKYQYPGGKTGIDSLTAFITFAIRQGILLDPSPEDYSTQVFTP